VLKKTSYRRVAVIIVVVAVVGIVSWQSLKGRGLRHRYLGHLFTLHPWVRSTRPAMLQDNVDPATFIAADVGLPNTGHGVDDRTLSDATVLLYRTVDRQPVQALRNTTGGGDAIVLQPIEALDPQTEYTFEVTPNVRDTSGVSFRPYKTTFVTGQDRAMVNFPGGFEKIPQPTTVGMPVINLVIGPDKRLYGTTVDGRIVRYDIGPGGTLGTPTVISSIQRANWGPRMVPGIAFDPASTPDNLIAWVTHSEFSFDKGADWTGKLSRLSGANLEHYQDYVINLPRSRRDHITAAPIVGPDGAIFFCQPSNTAMGAPDQAWGKRSEHLMTAAILRLDVSKITKLPLDAKTDEGGTYDPFAPSAPLTIYATGIRNALTLFTHSNGSLYAPSNGSAAGGSTPGYDGGTISGLRIDAQMGPYNPGVIPPLEGVLQTQNDFLYRIVRGGYYGHPNPHRNEFVLNGGNPTRDSDVAEVHEYPVGVQPDRNFRGFAYDFDKNASPNGIIEYKSDTFGGALKGKLLLTRYSGGKDIVVLTPRPDGSIAEDVKGIVGFTQLNSPLGLVEDLPTGNLYVSEFGNQRISLLRPLPKGSHVVPSERQLLFHALTAGSPTPPRRLSLRNAGTEPLVMRPAGFKITGPDAAMFKILNAPGADVSVGQFRPYDLLIGFDVSRDSAEGVKSAVLTIESNDPTTPVLSIELRGLVTTGSTADDEPSLHRILELHELSVDVGDPAPEVADLPVVLASEDEVNAQLFEKVLPDPVTIEPLACFGPTASPVLSMSWYDPQRLDQRGGDRVPLFTVEATSNKSVEPSLNGESAFDPGDGAFGLATGWPALGNRVVYSQDVRNTFQADPSQRRGFRFYRLKQADGKTIPNAYVFAIEAIVDSVDQQDFVGIIRNVRPITKK
jgi:hypothetical protein